MVQVHVDMVVNPAKEAGMLEYFHTKFRPEAQKFEGYLDVRMMKLRTTLVGTEPQLNYRFVITYRNEELRQKWIASADHARNWPLIENTLTDKGYLVLLTDIV